MKLTLGKPLKNIRVNQYFGANATSVYKTQGMKGHNGIDFYALNGEPVYATHDGTAYYQIDSAGGHGVVILSDAEYDYDSGPARFKTVYWHLVDPLKQIQYRSPIQDFTFGKPVKKGDLIGYADNTGMSTGSHLHFALKPLAKSGESNNTWYNLEQNNGYYGSIDPAPYFEPGVLPDFAVPKPQLTWYQKFLIGLDLAGVEWRDGRWQYKAGFKGKRY
jgi:murein DD-endopeptidase MepM/ murein hydrolase activator NlpD